ncbi:hypothetical protein SH668x_000024 [Planctomicrobium sp. SH668]|uniref:hypothetical protein n=1 Tax=Planctomicrobium sp. SH668 TaxID=3448126 RepID=UPI003F5BE613
MAYTPGLQVKAETRIRFSRLLPIPGEVLVKLGDRVAAEQVVAQTHQPGDLIPLNVANLLSVTPGDLVRVMKFKVGDEIKKGEILAESKGILGYFKNHFDSPADGTLESISSVTGQVILRGPPSPVQVNAFVSGEIVEVIPESGVVIETNTAFLQGIFGVGGEQIGTLKVVTARPDEDLTPEILTGDLGGKILVAGGRIQGAAVERAKSLGVKALIAGGIDDQDLKEILGYDLGVAITGSENIGLTIIITEGFGNIAMARRTFELLKSHEGNVASVNGATQIRAGVLRPEIIIPLNRDIGSAGTSERVGGGVLEVGAHVRLIRDPYFGELGKVAALPIEPVVLDSGSKARVLEVQCISGQRVIVPRANVEIVEE